jgi:RNA polymerase sigma factor for flagellar operon FliA
VTSLDAYEQLLVEQLPLVHSVIRRVARRYHLREEERQELESVVRFRLVDRQYELLRRFEGRSTLGRYLTTVVSRILLDERNKALGRWRPSAAARRLGPIAVELSRLVERDGHPIDEAIAIVASRRSMLTRQEIQTLCDRLCLRAIDRTSADADPDQLPTSEPDAFRHQWGRQLAELRRRAFVALHDALATLQPRDALMMRMRYEDGLTVAQIAHTFSEAQKPLYRRLERLCDGVREMLNRQGISVELVRDVLTAAHDPELFSAAEPKPARPRPSEDDGAAAEAGEPR